MENRNNETQRLVFTVAKRNGEMNQSLSLGDEIKLVDKKMTNDNRNKSVRLRIEE